MPNTSSVSKDITVTLKTIQHDKISAPRHTHLHGRIFVFATFTNTSDHTYWISTWGTPLGRNHFFDGILKVVYEPNDPVKRRILPYDALPLTGRVMKIKDYIKIPAKTSLKAVLIELTEFVDIDQTGEYEITMECHIKNVTKGAFVWPGVRAFNDPAKPTKLKIVGDGTAVIKSNTITKNLTAQHDFSLSEVFEVLPDRVSQGWSSSDVIKPPKFAKGSVDPDKVEATTKAHYAAAQYLTFMDRFLSSERDMTEDPTLMAWFGKMPDRTFVKAIRGAIKDMLWFMHTNDVTYDFNHARAGRDVIAFVYGRGRGDWNKEIYTATEFWERKRGTKAKPKIVKAKLIGRTSQAATILHELAHGVTGAHDYSKEWYGVAASQAMAKYNPKASILHADAYSLWAGSINPFNGVWIDGDGAVFRIQTSGIFSQTALVTRENPGGGEKLAKGKLDFVHQSGRYFFTLNYKAADGTQNRASLTEDLENLIWGDSTAAPSRWHRVSDDMVYAPPGTAVIGSPASEFGRRDEEPPQTEVEIPVGFFVSKYLATQKNHSDLFSLASNPNPWERGMPKNHINFAEAKGYVEWLDSESRRNNVIPKGWEYRLMSELEWEYVARAGRVTAFWYGDDDPSKNYPLNKQYEVRLPYDGPHTIDAGEANPWGLHDIHGNLMEWCDGFLPNAPKVMVGRAQDKGNDADSRR